jgi:DNA-directed RNA polymerase specialized sigma subunit
MESKEYLESYKRIAERLKVLTAEIERLRAEAESVSINLDGMPHGTGAADKTARLAIQLAEMETNLQDEMSHLWSKRMEIINMLGKMKKHKHQTLLHKRYIECKSWEVIAYEMGLSWRHCYRLHGSALNEFSEVMKNEHRSY